MLVTLLLAVPASCSYYVATYNNRAPTPLDGTRNVTAGAFRPPGLPGPAERVYFEHRPPDDRCSGSCVLCLPGSSAAAFAQVRQSDVAYII
ncbi:hypothetical protein GCM10027161_47490 [Microbispora hainanensis]